MVNVERIVNVDKHWKSSSRYFEKIFCTLRVSSRSNFDALQIGVRIYLVEKVI
jgi:hypothetical protein